MLYRDHRGSLDDSMKTVVSLPATRLALFCHLYKEPFMPEFKIQDLEVKAYGYDPRIKWHTHIVTIKGNAVGFTNEDVI